MCIPIIRIIKRGSNVKKPPVMTNNQQNLFQNAQQFLLMSVWYLNPNWTCAKMLKDLPFIKVPVTKRHLRLTPKRSIGRCKTNRWCIAMKCIPVRLFHLRGTVFSVFLALTVVPFSQTLLLEDIFYKCLNL